MSYQSEHRHWNGSTGSPRDEECAQIEELREHTVSRSSCLADECAWGACKWGVSKGAWFSNVSRYLEVREPAAASRADLSVSAQQIQRRMCVCVCVCVCVFLCALMHARTKLQRSSHPPCSSCTNNQTVPNSTSRPTAANTVYSCPTLMPNIRCTISA